MIATRGPAGGTSLLFVVPWIVALLGWPILGQSFGLTTVVGLVVASVGLVLLKAPARRTGSLPRSSERACAAPLPRGRMPAGAFRPLTRE
ncbi:hypothetical protein ACMYYO_13725 [Dermacoccaceae bacterium W4C1]